MRTSKSSTPRLENERARYKRALLAFHDSLEAKAYLERASMFRTRTRLSRDEEVIRGALLTAFVMSYGRCFVESRSGGRPLPAISPKYLQELSTTERTVHHRLVKLRHEEFAHSDADLAQIEVTAWNDGTLVPQNRVLRMYSISEEDVRLCLTMIVKLQSSLTAEMLRLQEYLAPEGPF